MQGVGPALLAGELAEHHRQRTALGQLLFQLVHMAQQHLVGVAQQRHLADEAGAGDVQIVQLLFQLLLPAVAGADIVKLKARRNKNRLTSPTVCICTSGAGGS